METDPRCKACLRRNGSTCSILGEITSLARKICLSAGYSEYRLYNDYIDGIKFNQERCIDYLKYIGQRSYNE